MKQPGHETRTRGGGFGCFVSARGVLIHEDAQDRFGQDEEEARDGQNDIKQQIDGGGVGRYALGQPPADKRRHHEQAAAKRHHDREEDAPPFAHESISVKFHHQSRAMPTALRIAG